MQKRRNNAGGIVQRTDKNTIASTTSHPTMTSEATAPAVILAFSLGVVARIGKPRYPRIIQRPDSGDKKPRQPEG
jgi:hypothetical protein